jgi:hypothetical protein
MVETMTDRSGIDSFSLRVQISFGNNSPTRDSAEQDRDRASSLNTENKQLYVSKFRKVWRLNQCIRFVLVLLNTSNHWAHTSDLQIQNFGIRIKESASLISSSHISVHTKVENFCSIFFKFHLGCCLFLKRSFSLIC